MVKIAKKHGVSARTVGNLKRAKGIVRPPHNRLPDMVRRSIMEDLRANLLTLEQIAAKNGVSYQTVCRIKKRAGIKRKPLVKKGYTRISEATHAGIVNDLRNTGLGYEKIARKYGVSTLTVALARRKAGIVTTARELRRIRRRQEIEADLRVMAETGQTQRQIAQAHNVSYALVSMLYRQMGGRNGVDTLQERLNRVRNLHVLPD